METSSEVSEVVEPEQKFAPDDGDPSFLATYPNKTKNFACSQCEYSAYTRSQVLQHEKTVHGLKKYHCDQCDFYCLTHGGLYLHQKAVHLGIRFNCNQCSYVGTQEVNLKRHIESKHGTIQYCCNLCNAKTKGLWYIETHLRKVHDVMKKDCNKYLTIRDISSNDGSPNMSDQTSDCIGEGDENEDCDEILDPSELLDQSLHHEDSDGESSIEPSEFLDHMEDEEEMTDVSSFLDVSLSNDDVVDGPENIKRKPLMLSCDQCEFETHSSGSLARHVNVVHKMIKWSCKVCHYVTNIKCSMIRHVQSIHLGWRYQCTFCDHVATQKGGLKYHIEKKHPGQLSVSNWNTTKPIIPNTDSLNLGSTDYNDLYEETNGTQDNEPTDYMEDSYSSEDFEGSLFEPSVEIEEVPDQVDDISLKYVGEDHDFSELFGKFNNNGEQEVQCELCTYTASRLGNMKRHVSASHQGIRFPCKLCNYKAPDKGSLMRHNRGVHQGIKFYCDFCPYSASQKGNLKKHVELKHPDKEYACPYCSFKVNWKGSIMKHINNSHSDLMVIHGVSNNSLSQTLSPNSSSSNESSPKKPRKEKEDQLEGSVKEETVEDESDVAKAFVNVDSFYDASSKVFGCPECDYKVGSGPSLSRHLRAEHVGIRWKCKDCDFMTRDKSSLKRHCRNRHDGLRYKCNHCEYDAGQKSNIKSHMDRKHPEIPYDHTDFHQVQVDLDNRSPGKEFTANGVLHTDHNSSEDFIECSNSADDNVQESEPEDDSPSSPHPQVSTPIKDASPSILLSALQSSSPTLIPRTTLLDVKASKGPVKSKRYNHGRPSPPADNDPDATLPCPECDYMAKSQGTLFRHVQAVHRGVRFNCQLCEFVTIDKGSLRRHIKGQHQGFKHKCDFCDYENAQIGNVKKHIETKHQNIVYHCPYCDFKAKHKWYLEQHVKKHHIDKDFDVKTVSPTIDSITDDRKLSPEARLFLAMFGNHPMAQFFVPEDLKTGLEDETEKF